MFRRLVVVCTVVAGALCGAAVPVPFWTDDYGYCKQITLNGQTLDPSVNRPNGMDTIYVALDQTLEFTFSQHHDLKQFTNKQRFDSCDFDSAVELASGHDQDCPTDSDFDCIAQATPFVLRASDLGVGTHYFGCSVGDHCVNGQKVSIVVSRVGTGLGAVRRPTLVLSGVELTREMIS